MNKSPNSKLAEAIKKDKRRREQRMKERTYREEELNPADFTEFMGNYHNQGQDLVQLSNFEVKYDFHKDLLLSLNRTKNNKPYGIDGIHNEMLRLEPSLTAEMLMETWRLIDRTKVHQREWKKGLLTPVYKKGKKIYLKTTGQSVFYHMQEKR